eukprot:6204694-Pleurochrysis_carterae.AAC.4
MAQASAVQGADARAKAAFLQPISHPAEAIQKDVRFLSRYTSGPSDFHFDLLDSTLLLVTQSAGDEAPHHGQCIRHASSDARPN